MEKEEMITEILNMENKLWNELNFWIDVVETQSEDYYGALKLARSRWASVNELVYKLGLTPIRKQKE